MAGGVNIRKPGRPGRILSPAAGRKSAQNKTIFQSQFPDRSALMDLKIWRNSYPYSFEFIHELACRNCQKKKGIGEDTESVFVDKLAA